MRILVVDDDPEILNLIRRGLAYEGHTVETAADGYEALTKAREKLPDLVVLDVMMPGLEGTEVARRLKHGGDVPILMLTAKGTVEDRVTGLDAGADDYLIKPFSFDELLARIRALGRRYHPREEGDVLRFADLTLNVNTMEVKRGETVIELTTQEFHLLEYFMQHPRQVLKRDQIYERVWGFDFSGESNVMEVYIRYLRSKLEVGGLPRLIHTVRGVGYALRE